MTPSWYIANPGSSPELAQLAQYVAGTDRELRYRLPIGTVRSREEWQRTLSFLGPFGASLADLAGRRALPPALRDPAVVKHHATALELAFRFSQLGGIPTGVTDRILDVRNDVFDWRNARESAELRTVTVALASAALRTFRKAAGVGGLRVLDYPIAHHDYARSVYAEEIRRFPGLGSAINSHQFNDVRVRRLEREIHEAELILTLSAFHTQTFIDAGIPRERLIQVPLGVDTNIFSPHTRERAESRAITIMFSGQLAPRKGIFYLMEAFRRLSASRYNLLLVGRAHPAITAALPHGAVHVPHLSRESLAEVYRSADIYVFPSLLEGFPQTPLEAMASGLPVIVSNQSYGASGPVRDGETGFLIDARDVGAMVDRIETLGSDIELRERLGVAAVKEASRYTWDRFVHTFVSEVEARVDGH